MIDNNILMTQEEDNYLEELNNSSELSHKSIIFNKEFNVESMSNPVEFLPKYQQNAIHQKTCNEQCLSCCGDICIGFSCVFGICGCSNCCCAYQLPTSYGND